MDWHEHLLLGAVICCIFAIVTSKLFGWFSFNIIGIVSMLIIIVTFSILPDIDHPISKITWAAIGLGILGLILSCVDKFVYAIPGVESNGLVIASTCLLLFTFICAQLLGHRGPTHTVWFGLIMAAALIYPLTYSWQLCILGEMAYLSHLWGDGYVFKIW